MSESEKRNEIISMPGELVGPERVEILDLIGSAERNSLAAHNFDGNPIEMYQLDSLAAGHGATPGSEIVGQEIPIKYWYCHRCASENARGEIEEFPRTVVITPDLHAYSFGSKGVFDCVRLLARYFGRKPLNPPVVVEVREVKTRRGMKMLTLVPKSFGPPAKS